MTVQKDSIRASLQQAVELHKTGNLAEAEMLYQDILQADPQNEDACQLLGLVMYQNAKFKEAADLITRATLINPSNPFYYNNLGNVLESLNRLDEAANALEQAIELKPDYAEAYNNLGVVYKNQQKPAEAAETYKKALHFSPNYTEAYYNLGNVYQELSKLDEAIIQYDKALQLRPNYAEALCNKGLALHKTGKFDEAENSLRHALRLNPLYPEALNNLGLTLCYKKQYDEAASFIKQAISLKPDLPEAYCNLGIVNLNDGKLAEALSAHRQAIKLKPDYTSAYFYLANDLLENAKVDEAKEILLKILDQKNKFSVAHSNLLFIMNYSHTTTQEEIYQKSLLWDTLYIQEQKAGQLHRNAREKDRKLKIGYISGDFRQHSVAFFIEPVLRSHDKENFEIYCYANVHKRDGFTERLQYLSDHWIDITGYNADEIAERVMQDRIDILVDLAGHTARNSLLAFGLKPAPIQITWLGYPNTTGLKAMDYRLTDAVADPEGEQEDLYSEKLVRLPQGFLCYQPDAAAPDITPPPCSANAHITFGSFNNLVKTTPEVIKVWSRILHAVPGSRLVLKARQLKFEETRDDYRRMFSREGIDASRIEFYRTTPGRDEHLKLYGKIDICLDPFPYNGTTTTCEALWMGIPVVTMLGDRHAGRVGASIMHHAGLEELVAGSIDEYIDLAVRMAQDTESLAEMRNILREELQNSRLMDKALFTKTLEDTYRQLWLLWCEEHGTIDPDVNHDKKIAQDSATVDIVIPHIKNDYWGEELRYVLRSLEKNFLAEFRVHIIGYCPPWCKNVNHIPFQDKMNVRAAANTGRKLHLAMQRFKRFVWTHDDIYFIGPVTLHDIQLPKVEYDMHSMDRTAGFIRTTFHEILWATSDRLKDLNLSGYYPGAHLPKYYESEKLAKVFELFRVEEGEHNPEFCYFNLFPEGEVIWELERIGCYSRKDYKRQRDFGTAKFLNHDNAGLSERLKKRIKEMFPEKSRFEK